MAGNPDAILLEAGNGKDKVIMECVYCVANMETSPKDYVRNVNHLSIGTMTDCNI